VSKASGYALVIAIALILLLFLILVPPTDWDRARYAGDRLQQLGLTGMLGLVVLGAAGTAVGLPRQVVAFTGGYAFGVIVGLALALIASLLGCLATLFVARHVLGSWVTKKYPQPIATLNRLLVDDVVLKIIVLRLQPLGTNLLTNLSAGVCDIPVRRFLLGTAIGYVPQALVFVLLGSGLRVESGARVLVSAVLLVVSILLGILLYRRHVARQLDENASRQST